MWRWINLHHSHFILRKHHSNCDQTGLPWWQKNHPDLVLYQCDRVTPAWECFAGEGCAHTSVPLDLTNPATLQYQLETGFQPAASEGYTAIALDNYGLTNQWSACGAFKGPNNAWVQVSHPFPVEFISLDRS